jgi:SAM-dependent methyltransferase
MVLARFVPRRLKELRRVLRGARSLGPRLCPLCGFEGPFEAGGATPRPDALCPGCGSLERHRLFWLSLERGLLTESGQLAGPVLHFAPEQVLEARLRGDCEGYQTADLLQPADLRLDLERIALDGGSQATVIANHVLEHVDDRRALAELRRIMVAKGTLVVSVPLVHGWATTYENAEISAPADRALHFGQSDHVRYYGRDFVERVEAAGFRLYRECVAAGDDAVRYALHRGESLFSFVAI